MSDLLFGLAALGLGHLQDADIFEELTRKEQALKEGPVIPEEKDMIFDKKMVCPVCDKEFMTKCLKAGKTRFLGNDLDLRPLYEGIDAQKYDIILCPNCGYAALNKFFAHVTPKQIKAIKENISRKVKLHKYSGDTYSYDQALERYQVALANALVKQAKTSEKAYLCLKNAWLLRGYAQFLEEEKKLPESQVTTIRELERANLKNAYKGFAEAVQSESYPICGMDEATLDYLLATVAYELEEYDDAVKILSNMLVSTNVNPRIKDKARDLKDMIREKRKETKKG